MNITIRLFEISNKTPNNLCKSSNLLISSIVCYTCQISYFKTSIMFIYFLIFVIIFHSKSHASSLNVSALFAFGDSSMDTGNNNGLPTLMRTNHIPYGLNFPGHLPTGRSTNGKMTIDFLASKLGIKKVLPAYLDPSITEKDLLTGVSFASAGSGLDDLTARTSGTLAMGTQLDYFGQAIQRMTKVVGNKEARRIVNNAVFGIGAGSNDMIFNFYDFPLRRLTFSLSRYQDFLLEELEVSNLRLYKMGARKCYVMGLPPIGCLPIQISFNSLLPNKPKLQRSCIDQQNTDSKAFNRKLQTRLSGLQASLPGAKIVYADIYTPMFDMIIHPSKYGFEKTLEGCCGTGLLEAGPLCNSLSKTCCDPSKFLFWDSIHPTQAMYRVIANSLEQTVFPNLTLTN